MLIENSNSKNTLIIISLPPFFHRYSLPFHPSNSIPFFSLFRENRQIKKQANYHNTNKTKQTQNSTHAHTYAYTRKQNP